jgi:outer membrane protein OmpA-like peptidoglycan-associated protein
MKKTLLFIFTIVIVSNISAQKAKFKVTNEVNINTQFSEYSPSFFNDGLVFITTNNTGLNKIQDKKINKPTSSIFYSLRGVDGKLTTSIVFAKELKTKFYDGPLTFNLEQNKIFFTQSNLKGGQPLVGEDGLVKLGIQCANIDPKTKIWKQIQKLPFQNATHNYEHPSITPDGKFLYFASDMPGGKGGMDLYKSELKDNKWSDPVNLGDDINSNSNEVFPYIHADGTLYFSSNRKGGLGGLDIYFTKSTDNKWMKPIGFELPLNSKYDDFGLIVDLDKSNGYFSSNRPNGSGEDDIFSVYSDEKIGELDLQFPIQITVLNQNTGTPITGASIKLVKLSDLKSAQIINDGNGNVTTLKNVNGTDVEMAPFIKYEGKSDTGGNYKLNVLRDSFLVIVKNDNFETKQVINLFTKEDDDLMVLMKNSSNNYPIKSKLTDSNGSPISGAILTFTDSKTGKSENVTTDENGEFEKTLENGQNYQVKIEKQGFKSQEKTIYTGDEFDKDLFSNLTMGKSNAVDLKEGSVIRLNNIYYNFNDANIRPEASKDLNVIYSLMSKNPSVTIELSSHTDSRGSDESNILLSQKRAESASSYLIKKGIDASRIKSVGYGEKILKNKCANGISCSEAQHQQNRRTEVKIVKMDGNIQIEFDDATTTSTTANNKSSNSSKIITTKKPANLKHDSKPLELNNGKYLIVAGTFNSIENASNQVDNLIAKGIESIILEYPNKMNAVVIKQCLDYKTASDYLVNNPGIKSEVFIKKL